jgi:hypothetical protein
MKPFCNAWRLLLFALAAGLIVVLAPPERAGAQQGQGQYVAEAAQRLGRLIGAANQDGYRLDNNQFSIGGGWFTQSKTDWVPLYAITLEAGKRYRLLAAGDTDARDVDLDVSDPAGKVVAADTTTAADARVDFTPDRTQKYLVRVRLYESRDNVPCLCLGIVLVQKQ